MTFVNCVKDGDNLQLQVAERVPQASQQMDRNSYTDHG